MASKYAGSSVGGSNNNSEGGESLSPSEKQRSFDQFFINNDQLTYIESGESDYYGELLYNLNTSIGELSDEVLEELTNSMNKQEFENFMKELSITEDDVDWNDYWDDIYGDGAYQEMPSGDTYLVHNSAQNQFFRSLDKKLHP